MPDVAVEDVVRVAPTVVSASPALRVPKSIRQTTADILDGIPESKRIVMVAQALKQGDETVVRGAVFYRISGEFSFVGYVSHNLRPKGLVAGAELRWAK